MVILDPHKGGVTWIARNDYGICRRNIRLMVRY
jgi:hypothetical protein